MNNRSLHVLLTRFGIIAAALATLLIIAQPAGANNPLTFNHAENSTHAIATFSASDPDNDAITWSTDGTDGDDFSIAGGVLSFKNPPNYEDAKDRDEDGGLLGTKGEKDNVYKLTVVAASNGEKTSQNVQVTVIDVDEPGSVSIDQPQPQVGRDLKAIDFSDPEGPKDEVISWSRGASASGPWTDTGASTAKYKPVAADVGNWMRVTYTYNDKFGSGKTVSAVSENAVEAKTVANAAPLFAKEDDADVPADNTKQDGTSGQPFVRSVKENAAVGTAVGDPVDATDTDNDVLVYTRDGAAKDCFSIDPRTGQVKVAKVLNYESRETACSGSEDQADSNAYTITVTATDPSTASATVNVRINVTNVNESPEFDKDSKALTTLHIAENTTDSTKLFKKSADVTQTGGGDVVAYTAIDNDGTEADTITYDLEGGDATKFEIEGNVLTKKADTKVDYESKSSYSIVVVAKSFRIVSGSEVAKYVKLPVTVKVVDGDDPGTVTLTHREPQVGASLSASVSDPDGDVTNVAWQWYRLASDTDTIAVDSLPSGKCTANSSGDCLIDGATSASYTVTADDYLADDATTLDGVEGKWLAARATYNDKFNSDNKTAKSVTVSDGHVQEALAANAAPKFGDQDSIVPGVQDESVTRAVAENTGSGKIVGSQGFTADDTDGDLLIYTLGGADAASFQLSKPTRKGNDVNLETKAALDYETKNVYTLTITATDPSRASDTISVTVNVTNVNEGATVSEVQTVQYAENGTGPVVTFSATDPEGDAIKWKLEGAKGVDNADFEIGEDSGVLTFKTPPNYEDAKDRDEDGPLAGTKGVGDRKYQVSVTANGGSAKALTVEVTDVDEPGSVSIDQPQPQVDRQLSAIEFSDPDGGKSTPVISWSRGASASGPWTDTGASTANYKPVAADAGNWLRVTYTYNDKFGSGKTVSAVSENAVEAKTLANAKPSFAKEDDADVPADNTKQDGTSGQPFVRSVKENAAVGTAVGDPVDATDTDNDVLVYTRDGAAKDCFSIDPKTGQVKVAKVLNYESRETACSGSEDQADSNAYTITVTATDPSTASATVNVRINVTNVNESPEFDKDSKALTTLHIAENTTDSTKLFKKSADVTQTGGGDVVAYTAIDNDGTEADTITYDLEGGDATKFEIEGNVLTKKADTKVDYESKSSYSIVVVAKSFRIVSGSEVAKYVKLPVTVKVVDGDDPGTVTLTHREPQVGASLSASVSDPDGDVTNVAWQWYRLASDTDTIAVDSLPSGKCTANSSGDCLIDGATSASYTVTADDYLADDATTLDGVEGKWLAARATYNDKFNSDNKTAKSVAVSDGHVQLALAANAAPKFGDQDRNVPGVQDESVTRAVAENTGSGKIVGRQGFMATDGDGDLLIYTLGGADAASFQLSKPTRKGNTVNLRTKAALDYETKNVYTLTITATDPSTASDTISVTVMVTDEDDAPTISLVTGVDPSGPDCTTAAGVLGAAALQADCQVLLGAESALGGSLNWDIGTSMAEWTGVTVRNGRVTRLQLRNAGLDGTIPAGLARLDGLQYLMLDRNSLSGSIPAEIGGMTNLVVLYLYDNNLTGDIPTALGGMSSLKRLYLQRNAFTGGIPSELGSLANLEYLWIYSNEGGLTGGIPSELGNATRLLQIRLHDNGLTGGIPAELGSLPRLRYLLLSRNSLSGSIPTELGSAANMKALYLYSNMLSGSIPSEFGGMVDARGGSVRLLYLHNNQLSGAVPSELGSLTSLTRLLLSGNTLTGCVPAAIASAAQDAAAAGLATCDN